MTTRTATLTAVLALGLLLAPALAAAQGFMPGEDAISPRDFIPSHGPPKQQAPAQDGPKMPATPTSADAVIRLDGVHRGWAEIRQTWEGPSAKAMRQSLNVIFGDKDEVLTQNELDNIGLASSTDMLGKPAPFFTWDDQPAIVANASVTFENGPGKTTATDPITMIHRLDLNLTSTPGLPHRAVLLPLWDGAFRLEWSEPWAADVSGSLDAPVLGKGNLTTRVADGSTVTVLLKADAGGPREPVVPPGAPGVAPVDASAPPVAPEESAATQAPPARKIPGVGLVGLVGALALVALVAAGRRRNAK